jgi:biotin operon repressor
MGNPNLALTASLEMARALIAKYIKSIRKY